MNRDDLQALLARVDAMETLLVWSIRMKLHDERVTPEHLRTMRTISEQRTARTLDGEDPAHAEAVLSATGRLWDRLADR